MSHDALGEQFRGHYGGGHQPDETGPPLHDVTQKGNYMEGLDVYENPHHFTGTEAPQESIRQMHQARGNPDHVATIYRAAPRGVGHINHGDWVTLSAATPLSTPSTPTIPSKIGPPSPPTSRRTTSATPGTISMSGAISGRPPRPMSTGIRSMSSKVLGPQFAPRTGEVEEGHVRAIVNEWSPGQYYLRNLSVHPEHRGQGVGTRFMHGILAEHDRAGTTVSLHARKGLHKWYGSMGFEPVAEDTFGTRLTRRPR